MSVHIFGLRCSTDCRPRSKNGLPAHNTTGRLSTNSIQLRAAGSIPCARGPAIANTATATVKGKVEMNRRRKSLSSGFSPSSRLGKFGLQHHAACWADPGMSLAHLGMHRAGINRALRFRTHRPWLGRDGLCNPRIRILFGIRRELALAARTAEIHGHAPVHQVMRRLSVTVIPQIGSIKGCSRVQAGRAIPMRP